ncbi:hypothetical protein Ga0466249_004070 [Sporomusaceae bacterium BoRhaA]|uniref:hypothetical protein n=1 Tax=Pelorhabdus rhamnosifermentans TaxID=2772457 RepID=UPI001C063EA7|nr:hypothetical protein [Pelorhabdus rhamnosifermentans]MBU2702935.1 hypothetical protein [Pelorhabdus rhamnosifermentans]
MTKSRDKDLYLKLRFKRILFLLGYYSPIEVDLSDFQVDQNNEKKRTSLTDLDVLGIKYDLVLTSHIVVGDCKSGRNVSDSNRLFWLKGVSEFFGADVAYFLRPTIANHARAIAPRLGLRILDENELSLLEENLKANTLILPIADPDIYETKQSLWSVNIQIGSTSAQSETQIKKVLGFFSYGYWYNDQYRNLFRVIHHMNSIAHLLDFQRPRDVLIAYIALERFTHCLLELGSYIYSRGLSQIPMNSKLYLNGGSMAYREREKIFDLLNQIGVKENIDPPFLPDIIEQVNRIINNPSAASMALTYLEAIYMWCEMMKKKDLKQVFLDKYNVGTIVLARDICHTFCKASGLNEQLYKVLMSL